MGIVEKRRYLRFPLNLPVRYYPSNSCVARFGRLANASEGGLLLYFCDHLRKGRYLRLNLPYAGGKGRPIEILTQAVWVDGSTPQNWDYRSGLKLIGIAPQDMERLRDCLAVSQRDLPGPQDLALRH